MDVDLDAVEEPLSKALDLNGTVRALLRQGFTSGALDQETIGYLLTLMSLQQEELVALSEVVEPVELPEPEPPVRCRRKQCPKDTVSNIIKFTR